MIIPDKVIVITIVLQVSSCLTSSKEKVSSSSVALPLHSNTTAATLNVTSLPKPPELAEVAEGGGMVRIMQLNRTQFHNREHVIQQEVTNSVIPTVSSTISNTTKLPLSSTAYSIPVYEEKLSNITDASHKKISARKGVNFNDTVTPNPTTSKPKPKKPLFTEASEDEPYAPSHFQSKNSSTHVPKVPSLERISESDPGRTQKYVVPIVVVILSVPFVAILISFLYKRGSEWWKYRHYRRMDFLINGMYDR